MYRARSWMPCLAALVISALPAGCTSPPSRVAVERHRTRQNALQQQLLMVARSYEMQGETYRARQLYNEILTKDPGFTPAREQLARLEATIVIDPAQRAARQHAIAQAFEREGRPEIAQRFYANLEGRSPAGAPDAVPGLNPPQLPIAATPKRSRQPVRKAEPFQLPTTPRPAVDNKVAGPSFGEQKVTPPVKARSAETKRKPAASPSLAARRSESRASQKKPAAGPLQRIRQSASPRLAMLSRWLLGRKDESRQAKPTAAAARKATNKRQTAGNAAIASVKARPAAKIEPKVNGERQEQVAAAPTWHRPEAAAVNSPQDTAVPLPLPLPELKDQPEATVAATDAAPSNDEPAVVEKPVPALPKIEPKALVMKLAGAPVTAPAIEDEVQVAADDFSVEGEEVAQTLPEPLAGLVARLHHKDAHERTLAAYLLGKSGQSAAAALPALRSQFDNESEMRVKIHLAEAIAKVDPADEGGMDALLGLLSNEDDRTRWLAVIALGDVLSGANEVDNANPQRSGKIAAGLVKSLKDDTPRVRSMAALALAHLKDAANPAVPELKKLLDDENVEVREAADAALACIQVSHTE